MENKNCPECSNSMTNQNKNWVEIDICNHCEWIFLEYWEIGEIINHVDFSKSFDTIQKWDFKKDNVGIDIICSNCQSKMEEREYIYWSWNHIDFCLKCKAVYLDKWELDDILNYEASRVNSKEWKEILNKLEMEWRKVSMLQKNKFDKISGDESWYTWFLYKLITKIFN